EAWRGGLLGAERPSVRTPHPPHPVTIPASPRARSPRGSRCTRGQSPSAPSGSPVAALTWLDARSEGRDSGRTKNLKAGLSTVAAVLRAFPRRTVPQADAAPG